MTAPLSVVPSSTITKASPSDLISRLDRYDETLTDQECSTALDLIGDDTPSTLDQATSAVRSIMRVHPRTDVDDPQAYALAAAAIMSEYPAEVLKRVSDPRTGIVRHLKFLPRLAEIAEACDFEMARRARLRSTAVGIPRRRRAAAQ